MKLSLIDVLSQSSVRLTQSCTLRCDKCPLEIKEIDQAEQLLKHIRSGVFHNYYPVTRLVNLVGGEPFLLANLEEIIQFFYSKKIKTRLWTTGNFEGTSALMDSLNKVNECWIYLPSFESQDYQLQSGVDVFERVQKNITWIKSTRTNIVLHTPINHHSIQNLADFYELSYDLSLPLVFHYSDSDVFDKETMRYIHRFNHVKDVYVFRGKTTPPDWCSYYPKEGISNPYQIIKNKFWQAVNSKRQKFGL